MTFQTQGVVGFEVFITDSLVIGFAPIKKPFIPDRLTLGALTLVLRVNGFAEVLAVRKEQQDTVCFKPTL